MELQKNTLNASIQSIIKFLYKIINQMNYICKNTIVNSI